jgi:hypothetical protein
MRENKRWERLLSYKPPPLEGSGQLAEAEISKVAARQLPQRRM